MSQPTRTPIRILVADDHPIVRDGLIAILSTQPDFALVGTAADGREVVRQVEALRPDVLLLDLAMPEIDGVEALGHVRLRSPETRVIVFTAFDTDERILAAVRAGAQGYLLKGAPRDDIFRAVRVVHAGGSLLEPMVASRLLRQIGQGQPAADAVTLTPRELEVLRLIARGLQNKEVAAELGITERTVKFHTGSVYRKLGAGNRTEAVALATQRGILRQPGT
ncbi:MAG: response regulator transcription factor [Ktedonobacterales bacterium]|nr:response regulator transcription factor [Ktedonobacterales bacterium]